MRKTYQVPSELARGPFPVTHRPRAALDFHDGQLPSAYLLLLAGSTVLALVVAATPFETTAWLLPVAVVPLGLLLHAAMTFTFDWIRTDDRIDSDNPIPHPLRQPRHLYRSAAFRLALALAAAIAVHVVAGRFYTLRPAVWMLTVFAFLLALGVMVILAARVVSFRAIGQALANWFLYDENLPIMRWGRRTRRNAVSAASLALLVLTVAPLAAFFPVTLFGEAAWYTDAPLTEELPTPLAPSATPDEHVAYRSELLRIEADARAAFAAHINHRPLAWTVSASENFSRDIKHYLATFVAALLLSTAIPAALLVLLVAVAISPALIRYQEIEPKASATGRYAACLLDILSPTAGSNAHDASAKAGLIPPRDEAERVAKLRTQVQELQRSSDNITRNTFLLGESIKTGAPIFLDRSQVHNHAHIFGKTGSGKTSLGLAPLFWQIIEMAHRDLKAIQNKEEGSDRVTPSSVVIIDMKGDAAFFNSVKAECESHGMEFKWFTSNLHNSTYVFNPLTQAHYGQLGPFDVSEIILEALGLRHEPVYGQSYFTRMNRQAINRLMTGAADRQRPIRSFRDLYYFASELPKKDMPSDAEELAAAIEELTPYDAINLTDGVAVPYPGDQLASALERQIQMLDVVSRPCVVYFYLPSLINDSYATAVGKLALYSLVTAAWLQPRGKHQVYCFIDEFQRLVSSQVEPVLQQARDTGVALILANQNIADLKGITETVLGNVTFRQCFSATTPDLQELLIKESGETVDYRLSWDHLDPAPNLTMAHMMMGADLVTETKVTEELGPRITRNDLIRMSADDNLSYIYVATNKGHARYDGFSQIIRSDHHITKEMYDRLRENTGWPGPQPGTLVITEQRYPEKKAPPLAPPLKETPQTHPHIPSVGEGGPTAAQLANMRRRKEGR